MKVFTKPSCVACDATKRKLDKHGAKYTTVDVTEDPEAMRYVAGLGAMAAPVVVLDDGTWFSGYKPQDIEKALGL